MPYEKNEDLPEAVREKYTDHEQDIFRAAFNSAWSGTCEGKEDKEECAFKIAHSAVENAQKDERKEQTKLEWEKPRYFNLDLCNRKFEDRGTDVIIKDVIALAEGVWTDSNIRTPCRYSTDVLREKVTIKDNGLWSRHAGGVPRAANEKIGYFEDAGYSDEYRARMVNLILHKRSQLSRDISEMIDGEIINMVSAEVGGDEWYNPKTKENEALTVDFYGLVTVDRGACELCLIRHKSKPDHDLADDPPQGEENTEMDEDTKKAIADLQARMSHLEKIHQEDEEKDPEDKKDEPPEKKEESAPTGKEKVGELSEEMNKQLKTLETRILALEKEPNPRTLARSEEEKEYI